MPSGPSHSHSSGGGHSGGGHSSFGGGSFSGSYGGGGFRPRGPVHMHFFGHTVILTSGKRALMSMLVVFCIMASFFALAFGLTKNQNKSDLAENRIYFNMMIEDNSYYKNMVQKAKEAESSGVDNGYYVTYAEFSKVVRTEYYDNSTPAIYYYGDYGAMEVYYVVYEYENEHETDEDTGEKVTYTEQTYAQFSQNDALKLKSSGKIKIAYHYDEQDAKWYSINLDYPTDITTSYEYKIIAEDISTLESSSKFLNTAFIVAIVIAVGLLVGVIINFVIAVKNSKKEAELEEQKKRAEIREKEAQADVAEEELKKKNRVCDYCGCTVPDGATKCPVCGASKFRKKK